MAQSYANPGGSGNRTSLIRITTTAGFRVFRDYPYRAYSLICGDYGNNGDWTSGGHVTFDFGEPRCIDEAKFYQSGADNHGTWQWKGSNDGSTFTDVGSPFVLGGATVAIITALNGNTTFYRYWRMEIVSGSVSTSPYLQGMDFRIDDATHLTGAWSHPQGWGDRRSLIDMAFDPAAGALSAPYAPLDGSMLTSDWVPSSGSVDPDLRSKGSFYWSNGTPTPKIVFDFKSPVVMSSLLIRSSQRAGQGFFYIEGSNNGTTWTELNNFEWGSYFDTIQDYVFWNQEVPVPNTTAYRYYRLRQYLGAVNQDPYQHELLFKMADGGGGGGTSVVAETALKTITLSPPALVFSQSVVAEAGLPTVRVTAATVVAASPVLAEVLPFPAIVLTPPGFTTTHNTQFGLYAPVDTTVDERVNQFGSLIPGQVQVNIRNSQMGLLVIAKGGETPLKPDPLKMQDGGRQPLLVQRLVNMYVETTPEGPVASKRVGRPGLAVSREFGGGAIRATFLHKGFRYTVAGDLLWRDGLNIGTLPKDGPIRWAVSDEEVVIMAGKRAYYVTLNDVTRIMDPDLPEIRDVSFLAGRFLYFDADNSGFYRYSDVNDARSIDGLAFASAEADPDAIIGGVRNGESVVIFGEKTVEFHYPTTDPSNPFQRSQGRTYDIGCRAIQTVQPLDNTLAFVGSDRLVYFVGQVPLRVSTSAIEDELRRQTQEEFEANTAFTITFGGHYFYVLNIVGRGTWALQASTKLWAEWKSWGMDRFRVSVSDGEGFMGCAFTGKVMYFDGSLFTDVGEPLERICSTWQGLKSGHMRNFMLALHTQQGVGLLGDGYGSDPHVEMRFSDHLGRNWSNWLEASLGAHGVRGKEALAQWTNLGTFASPGRAFEFRCTDPVEFTPFMVSINEWRP